MLPEETVDFELLAEDDFGVRQTGIEWSGQFTRPTAGAPAKGDLKLADGATEERRIIKPASFSPAAFGITPQKITLRGYVEDNFPKRGRIYSEPVTLYVLTRDEHVQMLKSKFDRNITEFEDLARREQELLDENQRLERLGGEELQKDEPAKRLETQEQAEAESKRRMENLTERMEELMKDAARNGDVQKETLKKMAESLKSMQELSQQDLPKVQEKLGDSREQSNTPEKAQKDVAKAVEEQKKAVEKMQEAIAKANDANRQFEAGTFVNRLKKAAGEQGGIASSLIDAYERILGVKSSKLDPSDQRRINEASSQQANTASDVRWLQEDLANFFARTQTESFKQILDEMKASQIDIGLEEIRSLLGSNHSYIATENSKKWAAKLTEWATKLEGEKDKSNSDGGGGGGQSPEDEDFEFMLRVMKLVQQEQDLRAQTRALEQLRRNNSPTPPGTMKILLSTAIVLFPVFAIAEEASPDAVLTKHREGSGKVADQQDELSADVQQLTIEQTVPKVIELLNDVEKIMDEATDKLSAADTGGDTLAAQTEIIEKIHAAAKEKQKQQGSGQSGSAMMDMMERMMGKNPDADKDGKGKGKGDKPSDTGSNGINGLSDAPNGDTTGQTGGKSEARRVPKASGSAGHVLPEEFRKALDAYNRGAAEKVK